MAWPFSRSGPGRDATAVALTLNAAIAALATGQHGVIALRQLIELGLSSSGVRSRVARGSLHPVFRGVYAVGHRSLTRKARWMAATLAYERAALSHLSAAILIGLLQGSPSLIHVTTRGAAHSRKRIRAHSGATLLGRDVTEVDRIPCTNWARTLLDVAPSLSRRGLERALDRSMNLELFDLRVLDDVLSRSAGRAGAPLLRAVLAEHEIGTTDTRSDFEEALLAITDGAEMPRPVADYIVDLDGQPATVDFAWPADRVIVEMDSWRFHSSPIAQARDRRRYRRLSLLGWTVLPFTRLDLDDRGRIAREIAEARKLAAGRRPRAPFAQRRP